MESEHKAVVAISLFVAATLSTVLVAASSCAAKVTRISNQYTTQKVIACEQAGNTWINGNCVAGSK